MFSPGPLSQSKSYLPASKKRKKKNVIVNLMSEIRNQNGQGKKALEEQLVQVKQLKRQK